MFVWKETLHVSDSLEKGGELGRGRHRMLSLQRIWGQTEAAGKVYFEFCCEELKYDYQDEPLPTLWETKKLCEAILPYDEV